MASSSPNLPRYYAVVVVALMACGLGLRYEALRTGFQADDYAQLAMLDGDFPVARSPVNLFSFSDGPEETLRLMEDGFYPWWTDPRLRASMLRPLASLSIWFDWKVFGDDPLGPHLHSACWWLAMVGVLARLLGRLLPAPVALLALALFALDEAHGVPLGWIANRAVFASTTLSLLALHRYLDHRRSDATGWRGWAVGALVAVSLGFGEYAVGMVGFFLGHALLFDRTPLRSRMRALAFVLVPVAAYVVVRAALGMGAEHAGLYVDPLRAPGRFADAVVHRLPVFVADLTLALRSDFWTFGFPWAPTLVAHGWVGSEWVTSLEPWRSTHTLVGLGCVALLVLAARTLPARGPFENVRWLVAGAALSLVPLAGSPPSSRLLIVPLVGFVTLLASFAAHSCRALLEPVTRSIGNVIRAVGGGLLVVFQLVVPAWLSRIEVVGLFLGSAATQQAIRAMPVDPERVARQDVIVLAAIEGGTSLYVPITRQRMGLPSPRACWTLSLSQRPHVLTRLTERSFTFEPAGGPPMLSTAVEELFRSSDAPFRVGDRVDLGRMRVTIRTVDAGKPRQIEVELDVSLTDPSVMFLVPLPSGYTRFVMPPVGETVVVPAPAIPRLLG